MSIVVPHISRGDIAKAVEIYERFSHLEVQEETPFSFPWPSVQGVYARATGIGYMSNKWDYKERDFIHEHDEGALPYVLRQKQSTDAPWSRTFAPKHRSWPVLGRALDIGVEFEETDAPHHISYLDRERDDLPLLLGDLSRRLLIIVDVADPKEPALLLWGRNLEITDGGITG